MTRFLMRHEALFLGALSMLAIVVVWQLVVDFGLIGTFFISTPTAVAVEAVNALMDGSLESDMAYTLGSFTLAFCLAGAVGVGLGALAGWFRDVEAALEPFIWFKYSAPTIAFYPLFIALFGYGTTTVVCIGFLFALTPVYANTLAGIKNADRDLVRAALSFGARPTGIFLNVVLPGSVPIVVAGLRIGVERALTGVIVAELFGAGAGLGYSIANSAQLMQTTPMMVSIVVVISLGVVLTQLLSWLERKADFWRVG